MTLRLAIHCPYCKRPVPSSPLHFGKKIACPHCRGEFVASPSAMSEQAAEVAAPPASRLTPAGNPPPEATSLAPPTSRTNGHYTGALPPAPMPLAVAPLPVAQPVFESAPPAKPRTAQFVADQVTGPAIAPAADGSLPKLQLADAAIEAAEQPESRPVPLWVALLVMILSTGLSALLLLTDTGTAKQETSKAEARKELERFYGLGDGPLLPYQVHLREARLARSRGDLESERNRYRHVLSLLRAEGRGPYVGLAGTPKDDEDLARLLTILLAND